jgi:hypothetical protein
MCCSLSLGEYYGKISELPLLSGEVLEVQVEKALDLLLLLD